MNQGITVELHFFIVSVLWGALVLLAYDQLRIIRRIIRHNILFVAIQDLIFWVMASVFIFAMIYVENSGTIRGFSVMGMAIGMVVYHFVLSDRIVKTVSRIILMLLYPINLAISYICKALRILGSKVKLLNNKILNRLKKWTKSFKILLINRKGRKRLKSKTKNRKARANKKRIKDL